MLNSITWHLRWSINPIFQISLNIQNEMERNEQFWRCTRYLEYQCIYDCINDEFRSHEITILKEKINLMIMRKVANYVENFHTTCSWHLAFSSATLWTETQNQTKDLWKCFMKTVLPNLPRLEKIFVIGLMQHIWGEMNLSDSFKVMFAKCCLQCVACNIMIAICCL